MVTFQQYNVNFKVFININALIKETFHPRDYPGNEKLFTSVPAQTYIKLTELCSYIAAVDVVII